MMGQHYGTQEVIRSCVRPGMLVRHKGITWKAAANTRGKLILSTLRDSVVIRDVFVEILLDGYGDPLGEYNKADYGQIHPNIDCVGDVNNTIYYRGVINTLPNAQLLH
ncbi:hypothetical protein [Cedecea davisae]|uniref:hypothetical protein n=1 Tax=Cedecea davisae TaxID=158484 RepID=UPI001D0B6FA3|nr:hypothetical protein [Cedecea davisae]